LAWRSRASADTRRACAARSRELAAIEGLLADEALRQLLRLARELRRGSVTLGAHRRKLGFDGAHRLLQVARVEFKHDLSGAHRLPGVDATGQNPTADLERQRRLDARAHRAAGDQCAAAAALHGDRADPRSRLGLDRRRFGSTAGRHHGDGECQQETRLVHDSAS
jgi:hypothetical protein